jgi:hypothetical protein
MLSIFQNHLNHLGSTGLGILLHRLIFKLAALDRIGTWDLVPLPLHVVPITSKWVFKIKPKSDGSIERYEARLVARGFQQTQGRDYDETFAPVAHMTTICTLIVVAASSWTISQMDVKIMPLFRVI